MRVTAVLTLALAAALPALARAERNHYEVLGLQPDCDEGACGARAARGERQRRRR